MKQAEKMSQDIKEAIDKAFSEDSFKTLVEATQKATGEETGTFEVVITTEDVDRMGEVIKADGWRFDNYMKNPIVLWGHDYHTLPVGITDSLEKTADGKILAKGRFAPESANPFAQQVRRLYDLGIIRATSVGFIPTKQDGNTIVEAELLEYSFVSVPANPMALSTLIKSNIGINELVTKGLLSIKEGEQDEAVVVDTDTPADVPADLPVEEPVVEAPIEEAPVVEPVVEEPVEVPAEEPVEVVPPEKQIQEAVLALADAVKLATLVLEKLTASEHKETPVVEGEEEKAFREFSEKRRILQVASTVIADVLAEARRGMLSR